MVVRSEAEIETPGLKGVDRQVDVEPIHQGAYLATDPDVPRARAQLGLMHGGLLPTPETCLAGHWLSFGTSNGRSV